MEYVKVADTKDFVQENKLLTFLLDKEILLTKIEDNYYAINNRCTHMGGSLIKGRLFGYEIVCPKHHTRFDVRTGKVSKSAKILFIKMVATDTVAYTVKVEGTDILIGVE